MALAKEQYTNQYPYYVGSAMRQGATAKKYAETLEISQPATGFPLKEVPARKTVHRRTREQIIEEQKHENAMVIRKCIKASFVALAVVWVLLIGIVFMSAKATEIQCQINELNYQNAVLENETKLLNSKIEGTTSMNKVEKVAIEKLGMVYPSNKECTYMNPAESNKGQTSLKSIIIDKAYSKTE